MATSESPADPARAAAMAVLAQGPAEVLQQAWDGLAEKPGYRVVRGPEIGLVMVRGRMGGGGAPFNLGETTVTRTTVQLESGEVGHAYCLGRDTQKSLHAALFDALWQQDAPRIDALLIAPLAAARDTADDLRRRETAATKVDFFTMVRGDD